MRRAAELAGSAVGAAAKSEAFQTALNEAKGKTAKFGVQFGDWFEKNFNRIEKTVNERERELKQVEAGDSGQSQPEQKPPPKKAPTYQWGQGDGGPGKWGPPTTPRNSLGVAYQEQVTGAPAVTEYKVPLASRKSGFVDFDGYDPDRNVLIDAKDYNNWPPDDPPFLRDKAIDKILSEADDQVEAANGTPIEWHVPTDAKAVELTNIFKDNGVEGITVVTTPK